MEYLTKAEYRSLKTKLTRAVNSKNDKKIIEVCKEALDIFEDKVAPDNWMNWQRAKEDAEYRLRRSQLPAGCPQIDSKFLKVFTRMSIKPMPKKQTQQWELIEWDGNPDLKLKCWRKKFGRGHVSVGVDDFLTVVYSYGANSDDSISSTRWHYDTTISEKDMMAFVDSNNGKCQSYPKKPGIYRNWFNGLNKETQDAMRAVNQPWHDMVERRHIADMAI